MPTPSYFDSKEKLIEDIRATEGSTSRQFDIAKAILDVKGQEDIAKHTKELKKATWVLAFATIGLVIATLILVYVTIKY